MATSIIALASAARLPAQGTPYVPLLDPSYDDLDVLVSAGAVTNIMLGERPYSEAAFRRFVEQAREHPSFKLREREALARLLARFGTAPAAGIRLSPAVATVALADAPNRAMRDGISRTTATIDADLNLLLQRNQGRRLLDGATIAAEGGAVAARGHFAAEITSRVWAGVKAGGDADASVDLVAGYGRAVLGAVAMDIGRTGYLSGHGVHGGAMFSDNPRALDQVRLRADRPVRLPSVLSYLGQWQGMLAVANLGWNRDNPNGTLVFARMSHRPSRFVEWALNYQVQYDGEGAPPSYQWMRLEEVLMGLGRGFGFQWGVTDRVMGADARISIPQFHAAVYANFLTTDWRSFSQPAGGYWEDAIWVGGIERRALGAEGRLDLVLEGRHHGAIPQTHHQYTSGMTEDRRTLGDAMGPNGEGLSLVATWNGSGARWRVETAMERYSGDRFWVGDTTPLDGNIWNWDWRRLENNPDELRQRLMVDWERRASWRGALPTLRVGYEHVARFDWTSRSRHNLLLQLTLRRDR